LRDAAFAEQLTRFIKSGKPVLLTDGLAKKLEGRVNLDAPNVRLLPMKGEPKSLLELPQAQLDELRAPLLGPFKTTFRAPNQTALYLFKDGSWVIENFTDQSVEAQLNGEKVSVPARSWTYRWR
jgi:hypothetical protein